MTSVSPLSSMWVIHVQIFILVLMLFPQLPSLTFHLFHGIPHKRIECWLFHLMVIMDSNKQCNKKYLFRFKLYSHNLTHNAIFHVMLHVTLQKLEISCVTTYAILCSHGEVCPVWVLLLLQHLQQTSSYKHNVAKVVTWCDLIYAMLHATSHERLHLVSTP